MALPTMKEAPKYLTIQKDNFKKAFLSDPSVYPLIFIVGCTLSGFFGFAAWHLEHDPDVRINPKKRNALFRYWE